MKCLFVAMHWCFLGVEVASPCQRVHFRKSGLLGMHYRKCGTEGILFHHCVLLESGDINSRTGQAPDIINNPMSSDRTFCDEGNVLEFSAVHGGSHQALVAVEPLAAMVDSAGGKGCHHHREALLLFNSRPPVFETGTRRDSDMSSAVFSKGPKSPYLKIEK